MTAADGQLGGLLRADLPRGHPRPRTAPIPVSVTVITRNEAANLPICLAALTDFSQVVVVDSHSDDGTAAVARACGAQVVPFTWDGAYPKKKEWARRLPVLRHDWLLQLDADEVVTPQLAAEIAALMQRGPAAAGYWVGGRPQFIGRPLRFGQWNRKIVLFDRRQAQYPDIADHDAVGGWEVEGHYQPRIDGPVGALRHPLLHGDRKPFSAWVARHNRYSDWEVALGAASQHWSAHEGRRRRWAKRLFAATPARPLAAFLYSYVLRLGFLDGVAGLHYAVSRAVYYWLIAVKRAARHRGLPDA